MSLSSISSALRRAVLSRDAGRCVYCGLLQTGQSATFHVDHIIPRSRGGVTALDNLVLQCPSCSLHKSNRVAAVDPQTGDELPLFNPLIHRWGDHFEAHTDGMCVGLSPTGRATVEALQMNAPLPRTARALQHALGLFGDPSS